MSGKLVDVIYHAITRPEQWPAVLQAISSELSARGATIVFAKEDGSFGTIASTGLAEAGLAYASESWWRHDLVAQRAVEFGFVTEHDTFSSEDVVDPDEMQTLPIKAGFYDRFGIGRLVAVNIVGAFGLPASLSLHRAQNGAAFTEAEIARLVEIGRHVETALRLSLELIERNASSAILSDALDRMGVGQVLLAQSGGILTANSTAQKQFQRPLLPGQSLTLGDPVAQETLQRICQASNRQSRLEQLVLNIGDEAKSYLVQIAPVSAKDTPEGALFGSASALVIISPASLPTGVDPAVLRLMFNLTAAESRLASLTARAMPLSEVAETLSITTGTARTVLHRVFEKVGVGKQAELVARFSSIARLGTLDA